jgi:predicted nucleic acid-binding protein
MAVSNTSPIVYLVKIEKLKMLKDIYSLIYVCSSGWQDIGHLQARGLLTPEEIFSIAKARHENWLVLKDSKGKESMKLKDHLINEGLGQGEAYSIALAKELKTIFWQMINKL